MTEQKVSVGTRLGTMILDHIVMTLIIMLFALPDIISSFSNAFHITHEQMNTNSIGNFGFLAIIGFSFYFCKDCINGQSIAKRILKLQVVDNKTGQIASPIKCFIRDLFCILWPMEVFVALANPSRRLGDLVAGTKLIPYIPVAEKETPNYLQIFIAVMLSIFFVYLISLPFKNIDSKLVGQKVNYVESSFNEIQSKATETLFSDSLGTNLSSNVKLYDKVQNDSIKYISIIFLMKKDYFEDENSFDKIRSRVFGLLKTRFSNTSFISNIKYVYKEPGSMQTQTFHLDSRQK
jgi:uncharacterized RDD family membrane protein YckC